MEELKSGLEGIPIYELLYLRLGSRGNPDMATLLSKRNVAQQAVAAELGLGRLQNRGGR